jgi:Ca2+-binding EF-hand superfamily protein
VLRFRPPSFPAAPQSRFCCSHGEKFSQEELEEMLAAAVDVETGRIYYEDFAELLADS